MRAPEKPSASSDLGDKRGNTPKDGEKPRPRLTVELVCQGETKLHDPFWDGPRLVPGFATQLLGQVMAAARETRSGAAYSMPTERRAALLDLRS